MADKKIKRPGDPETADRFVWKPESIVIVKAKPEDPQSNQAPKAPKGGTK